MGSRIHNYLHATVTFVAVFAAATGNVAIVHASLYPIFNALENCVPPWCGPIVSLVSFREKEWQWTTVEIIAFPTFLPVPAVKI